MARGGGAGSGAGRGARRAVGGLVDDAAGTTLRRVDFDIPPRTAREARFRERVRGTTHPRTGIEYDSDGFPIFESQHDFQLPADQVGSHVSDTRQMRQATQDLRDHLDANPAERRMYTQAQLDAIDSGKPRIPGLSWHHHQDGVTLQLVDRADHRGTGHYGGRAATGGRS